ncbi:hypothetical protein DPEC_G00187610 [Dallia pectoralis]|uniref:Uncharacterized protein n=1 Tax=Dallia pectoralis TaxID=75939 RepID=A0ACC2GBQ1_DALPE|nr:hypothetical protein DPEC_G00187610 [Dallia pectoralis]
MKEESVVSIHRAGKLKQPFSAGYRTLVRSSRPKAGSIPSCAAPQVLGPLQQPAVHSATQKLPKSNRTTQPFNSNSTLAWLWLVNLEAARPPFAVTVGEPKAGSEFTAGEKTDRRMGQPRGQRWASGGVYFRNTRETCRSDRLTGAQLPGLP